MEQGLGLVHLLLPTGSRPSAIPVSSNRRIETSLIIFACIALVTPVLASVGAGGPGNGHGNGSNAEPNENAQVACENTQDRPGDPPFCEATALSVAGSGPSAKQAGRLADALGLPEAPLAEDGALRWLDPERFQRAPMQPADGDAGEEDEDDQEVTREAFDIEALEDLSVLSDEEALEKARRALRRAGLFPDDAEPRVSNAVLDLVPTDENQASPQADGTMSFPLDTSVGFDLQSGDLPLLGPGAKIRMTFDGQGHTTQLLYAVPDVEPGLTVNVTPPKEGEDTCREAYGAPPEQKGGPFEVESEMALWSPPLELGVETIYPHFICRGTLQQGDESVVLRNIVLPAVQDAPGADVSATMEETQDGVRVEATASIEGGTQPYTCDWSSAVVTLPPDAGDCSGVSYNVTPRAPVESDTVTLQVVDANGLTTTAMDHVDFTDSGDDIILFSGKSRPSNLGRVDVGAEWVGSTANPPLGGSGGNAGGWVTAHAIAGVPVDFAWSELAAWEQDWKDPTNGGDDSDWIDNVDAAFYTGHANGNGWQFSSSQDDKFLRFNEANWGDRDLEWLVIAACGPLQSSTGAGDWFDRWGPAMDGLHILNGYATVSYDNQREGKLVTGYMQGDVAGFLFTGGTSELSVRQAWVQAAIDTQGGRSTEVVYGHMGPLGSGWTNNYNDFFWGQGPVGPDIPDSQTIGYWRLTSSA